MSGLPQLEMINPNLLSLEKVTIPEDIVIHTLNEGTVEKWEEIINDSFESHFSFTETVEECKAYSPDGVLFASVDGEDLATAACIEDDNYPDYGYLHMVGGMKKTRGKKLGFYVVYSVLEYMKEKGYEKAVLKTDDFRIPAIKTYLKLGFKPSFSHESHEERWKKIFEIIETKA